MNSNNLLQQVYDATRAGLDIITDLLPAVDDAVINNKKAFRLRPDERTPSAHLYPPKDSGDCWHVMDYGMGEGGGYFTPIKLYMWERGYGQEHFRMALEELAQRYGVQEQLSAQVNKPSVEMRALLPEEKGTLPSVSLFDGFGGVDLSCWGEGTKPEHLTAYGWSAVSEVRIPCGDKMMVRKPTDTYPIFAQRCEYTDERGQQQAFYKVYEPKNYDKAHRFLIVGQKPRGRNYIYGLSYVRKAFQEQGEEKLPVLLLVSGGSDAIAAHCAGYPAVWLDSEVKGLSASDYVLLMKYCHRLVCIPDIDDTGIKAGRRQALTHLGIYTAWLTDSDMGGLCDNRGRRCKDLRDYRRLNPSKHAMDLLIGRALSAQFWTEHVDKKEQRDYSLSLTSLNYFLELNGFYTLPDDTRSEPVYIRIEGIVVRPVTAKDIVAFLRQWMEEKGLPQALRDKVLRSRDLPTAHVSTLRQRTDLDFRKGDADRQFFHFRNCWVEVSAQGVKTHRYSDPADHFVWEDNIIQHDYRPQPDMFNVKLDEDGQYTVALGENMPLSNFLVFLANTARLYWRKVDEGGLALTPEEEADEHRCLASRLANLGYLLTSHKSESEAWATICMDSTMAESADECNGRSGKSFYMSAIGKMVKTFKIDAGMTSFREPRFLFDGVTTDTRLVFIDECPRKFNYNFFYGMVSNDFRVEEKNRHSYVIPFADSPKFVLATNFTLSRHDPSTEGRIWPQPFSDYYHVRTPQNDYRESRSIRDDFHQNLMGTEYSEQNWQLDLAFMLQCVRFYLSLEPGSRRIMPPLNRIERREQMAAIGKDFRQWADEYFAEESGNLDCELKADQVLADFNNETKFNWSAKRMTQHLVAYCQFAEHLHCLNPMSITHKTKDGERWQKRDESNHLKSYYYIMSAQAAAKAGIQEAVQQPLAFDNDADKEQPLPFDGADNELTDDRPF